jgi:hypothetical protein
VYAILTFEETVGQLPLHLQRGGFDAGIVAILPVGDSGLVILAFAPALVHAKEHGSPILALGAAGTGIDLQYRSQLILFTPKHVLQLQLFDQTDCFGVLCINLLFRDDALFHKIESELQLIGRGFHLLIGVDPEFQLPHHFHLFFCRFGIVPEVGRLGS